MIEKRIPQWSELHTCRRCQGKLTLEAEGTSPATECICPGGSVWRRLEPRPIGAQMRLTQARLAWEAAKRPRMVYYFREGVRCEMDLGSWRRFLVRNWDALLAFQPAEEDLAA